MKHLSSVAVALLLHGCFLAGPASTPGDDGGAGCVLELCNGLDDDCDGAIDEAFDRLTSREHCGECGAACVDDVPNAARSCRGGACEYTCDAGFLDCDGAPGNGCEARLGSPEHCAGCRDACGAATPFCLDDACVADCPGSRMDCAGSCVDTQADPLHCGGCGQACAAAPGSAPRCVGGACDVACDAGFADCDGVLTNGCEAELGSDAANCGACGNACPTTGGAAPRCEGGSCGVSCSPGRLDCDADPSNGCEVVTESDASNCGACDAVCPGGPNATASCVARSCRLDCAPDFADCDGDASNGCESDSRTDVANCGGCGSGCAAPAGRDVSCVAGGCVLGGCAAGFADCDSDASGSCETPLGTVDDCAGCGDECTTYGQCSGGVCSSGCGTECGASCIGSCCEPGTCGPGACSLSASGGFCPSHLDCRGAPSCDTNCSSGARCATDCRGAASCTLDCTGFSTCELDCRGAASCDVDCTSSSCLIRCDGPSCSISCQGGARDCGSGVFACGLAACP